MLKEADIVVAFQYIIKNCLKNKIEIVEKNQCGILWIKIRGELFRFEEDVYVCNLYIPPASSKVLTQYDYIYEILEENVLRYKTLGKVYITGYNESQYIC